MFATISKLHRMPIGLDLGHDCVRMLQLNRTPQGLAVLASGSQVLPEGLPDEGPERHAVLVETCRAILGSAPFRGRRVVSCLPASAMQYKNIRLPKMPFEELREAARWEAADRMQIEQQTLHTQFLRAGEVRHGDETREELILMAVSDQTLRDHLTLLTKVGLRPDAIDSVPTAIARCFARLIRRQSDQGQVCVFLDVGASCSKILIARDTQVVFFKLLEIGGCQLNQAVADQLNLSLQETFELRQRLREEPAPDNAARPLFGGTRRESVRRAVYEALRPLIDELVREVGLCLRYHAVTFRGQQPSQVLLLGQEAVEPLLMQGLGERLGLKVEIGDPLSGIDLSAPHLTLNRRNPLPEWTVAAGLALRTPAMNQQRKRGAA